MKKYIVAGNWKMNTDLQTGMEILEKFMEKHECKVHHPHTQVIIFPPSTHLSTFSHIVEGSCIAIGAQNMYHLESGAYTGEISAGMIKSAGCKYVIVGHSERRQYFKEGNQLLEQKVKMALQHEITPIYCCGESLAQREGGKYLDILEVQITEGLFHLTKEEFRQVVIAYEPVWAIGTGKTASPEQAQEVHKFIREIISFRYGDDIAKETLILYGGSVKAANASELFAQPDINGGLVGGASLKPDDFEGIIKASLK